MKKLFTLLALLTCFIGAKAEVVVDLEVDYSTYDKTDWNGGFTQKPDATTLEIIPNVGIHVDNPEATSEIYNVQFQLPGVPKAQFDSDTEYTVTFKIKGSVEGTIGAGFSGAGNTEIPVTTSEETIVLTGQKDVPTAQYWASSGSLMVQSGTYVGEYWITYVKIEHEQTTAEQPVGWKDNMIVNGDAETPWEDPTVDPLDAENNYKVCAWGKEYDQNSGNPHPATIEEEEGNPSNHVFVVHSTATNENPWDNQFWIMSPKELHAGDLVKISLRYKASTNITASIQGHDFPSQYLNNFNMGLSGGMSFTTEWQTYEAEVEWEGGWSIVWNLNSSSNTEPVDFYFDDITMQQVDFEEGCFVVAKTEEGEYDYSAIAAFEEDPEEPGVFSGTVGASGEWVNEVIISTKQGNKKIFLSGAIKPASGLNSKNVETWMPFTYSNGYKYALPAGVWQIEVDTNPKADNGQLVRFTQIEGEELVEPIDIVVNKSELLFEAVEREDLIDTKNNDTGEITVREEPDFEDGSDIGGEGHLGQTWDNQFWIVANRALAKGEATVIEFDYVADEDATSTTQCQGDQDQIPGPYRWWSAIGDVNFTTEEQHFKQDFTVPDQADGMRSISFDFAVMKAANNYTIKNIKWYIKNDELNAQDLTLENLIDAEGTGNFWEKIGRDTNPYLWGNPEPQFSPYDINQDGKVNLADVRKIINLWKAGEEGYNLAFARKAINEWKKAE